jgi:GAF domain-containing protein
MTAMALKSVRASIIKCEPNRIGLVKASSDDQKGNEWNLDLRKYPEILYVINTGKTLAIENLDSDPTLNQIKQYFANISFNSMIVVPISLNPDQLYGVLAIRMPPDRHQILDEELRFAQILSQCISLALRLNQDTALDSVG